MAKIIERKLNIKIENLKAHVSGLQNDIQVYNTQAEIAINERQLAATQLSKIKQEIADRLEAEEVAYTERREGLETLETKLNEERRLLDVDKAQLATERNDFENYKAMEKFVLAEELEGLQELIEEQSDIVISANKNISKLNEEYKLSLKRNKDEAENHRIEWNKTQIEIEQAEEYLSELKNDILSLEKQKEVASIQLREYLLSKKTTLENLDKREKDVSVRERDAGVIARRLQKIYKEHYPNRKLNI